MDGDHHKHHTGEPSGEPAGEPPLVLAIRDVHKALDVATDLVTFTADRPSLGNAMCELTELRNRVDGLCVAIAGAADRSGVATGAGLRTVAQFVAARTNTDPATIRPDLTLARWLRDLPRLETALTDGVLSRAHLHYLRTKVDSPRSHFKLAADQEFFVETARTCSFDDFTTACQYWLVHIDPDGEEPQDQLDSTRLSLRRGRGGRLVVDGEYDAVTGQILETAIDAEVRKLADDGCTRTQSQRRAQALINLVTRGAARQNGTFPAPLINIVMSLKVAEWLLEQQADPTGEPTPVHHNDIDGRCELIDGTPIHPKLALATLGIATLRRYIMSAESRNLDVSVNARSFPHWMKIALHVESRGRCDTHGCDAHHAWIQTDHVHPVDAGGPTTYRNGQNQCSPDNHHKGSTTGHLPWRDRPKPRFRPPNSRHRGEPSDADHDRGERE